MWTSGDYEYFRNRCYTLRKKVYNMIYYLNSASGEMAKTLDLGNYFQINGHSADNGKFGKTKEEIDNIRNYLQNRIIPYLDREIYNAGEKIKELLIMENSSNGI